MYTLCMARDIHIHLCRHQQSDKCPTKNSLKNKFLVRCNNALISFNAYHCGLATTAHTSALLRVNASPCHKHSHQCNRITLQCATQPSRIICFSFALSPPSLSLSASAQSRRTTHQNRVQPQIKCTIISQPLHQHSALRTTN